MNQVLLEFLGSRDAANSQPPMITFLVGQLNSPDVEHVQLRQDLVFERAPNIQLHCGRHQVDRVDLTHRDPRLVNDYLTLLRDNISPRLQIPTTGGPPMDVIATTRYITLSSLYLFCVQMGDTTSSGIVFCAIVHIFHYIWPDGGRYIPTPGLINHVYSNSPIVDPLRSFLADCYIDFANLDWYALDQTYPRQFIMDVLVGMLHRRDLPKRRSKTANPRNYMELKEPRKTATTPATKPAQ